jgi:hypothetical protein
MSLPIPQWLLSLLIVLAKNVGLPLLIKLWPGLPKEVIDLIEVILSFISGSPDKPAALAHVRAALTTKGTACTEIGCQLAELDLKREKRAKKKG